MDLMERRRRGLDVLAESLLKEFPILAADPACVLDLIDAEICVRRELADDRDVAFFAKRFPELSNEITQLVMLDGSQPPSGVLNLSHHPFDQLAGQPLADNELTLEAESELGGVGEQSDVRLQGDFRVPGKIHTPGEDLAEWTVDTAKTIFGTQDHHALPIHLGEDSIDAPIPIQPPDWMTGAKCVATEVAALGRSWLVKGRDGERGDVVAMKVIPLPATLGKQERTRMLDLCESASNVVHDAWETPRIAAINNGHLAVVRGWIFSTPHVPGQGIQLAEQTTVGSSHPDQGRSTNLRMNQLVTVAFAVAAAHRAGATHGGISFRNLLVDHQQRPHLVDCVASSAGWSRYLAAWDNDLARSLQWRRRLDSVALLKLVSSVCLETHESVWRDWFSGFVRRFQTNDAAAAAEIGEQLQEAIDRGPEFKRSWWRR